MKKKFYILSIIMLLFAVLIISRPFTFLRVGNNIIKEDQSAINKIEPKFEKKPDDQISELPRFFYKENGIIYETDVRGNSTTELFRLWKANESARKYFIHYPDGANKLLVQVNGPNIFDIRQVPGFTENNWRTLPQVVDMYTPQKLVLIDTHSHLTINIPKAPLVHKSWVQMYFVASSDEYVYSAEYTHDNPFEDYQSMNFKRGVIFHLYDLEKNEWRRISDDTAVERCGRTLVMDPWQRDKDLHIIFNFNLRHIRMVEDGWIKQCEFSSGHKEPVFQYDKLCPNNIIRALSPSAYNPDKYIFSCSIDESSVGTAKIGIYDVKEKKITEIASYNNPLGQATGFYEGIRYLLSPDQGKFTYGYMVTKEENQNGVIYSETEKSEKFLYFLETKEKRLVNFLSLYRAFSPLSDYIVYADQEEVRSEAGEIVTQQWNSYEINTGKIYPIVKTIDTLDGFGDAIIGWVQ